MQASTRRSGPSGNLPPAPRRSAIAYAVWLAVGSATLTLAAPRPTLAQAAAQQAPGMRQSHDIPAGPLAPALRSLAGAANMLLTFTAEQTNGKTTTGIRGQYTPEEALAALLADSGLQAVKLDNGGYVLRATPAPAPAAGASAASEAALPAVRVTAVADARDGTTEHTGSYTTRASTTATKLSLSPRETPQTLTVVTRQKMSDFGLTSVDTVLESTSAVGIEYRGNNGAAYYIRGFITQSQYDGIPNPIGIGESNTGPSPDTAFLDRVEILQGASGLMTGAGNPGGTINLIRKRPTEDFQAHVEAQLGSWNKKRLVGDVSGPLVESVRVRGRAVALIDKSDSFKDYTFNDRKGFYGVIEADLTDTTTLGASVLYQHNKLNEDEGVPMAADGSDLVLPRSSFFGQFNGGGTRENRSYSLDLKQRLSSDWFLKAAYTHSENDNAVTRGYLLGDVDRITGDGLLLRSVNNERQISSDIFDVYASGPFHFMGRKHELAWGATRMENKARNRNGTGVLTPVNAYNYDASTISRPNNEFPAWPEKDSTTQTGAYGVAKLSITDSLKLITGMRLSWYEFKSEGVSTQKESSVASPYGGLLYDLNDNYTIYASYSDIFKPQSNLMITGNTLNPIKGKNYEVGIKGEFLQGRLNASAAFFQLKQSNLLEIDTSVPEDACKGAPCFKGSSLVISRGIDLGINGAPAPGWQIGAAYTYVDSKYERGMDQGKVYNTIIPKSTLRAYTTYHIPDTKWIVGGDLKIQSKIYSEDTGWRIQQGGYALIGLTAGYQINKKSQISVTVNNLLDKRYYRTIYGYATSLWNFYGDPRNVQVNLRHDF